MSSKGFGKSLLLVSLFLLVACAYGEDNILTNPGFEDGTSGWTGRGCMIEAVDEPVHSGSQSAKTIGRTDTWNGIKQSVLGKMVPGETYLITAWVRIDGASSDTVTISVEQQDDDGTAYHNVGSDSASDDEWVELSGKFTLSAAGTLTVLDVYVEGAEPGVDIYVDDVNVYGATAGNVEKAAEAKPAEEAKPAKEDKEEAKSDGNILTNPGFEDGISGWAGRENRIEAVDDPVHSGSKSAKATGRTQAWNGIKQSVLNRMVPGETYQLSAWVRVGGASSDNVAISVEQQDGEGTNYHNVASSTASDSSWVQLSGEFTLEVSGSVSLLDVYIEGPEPGVDIYVDDVKVIGAMAEPVKAKSDKLSAEESKAKAEIDVSKRQQKIEGFGAAGAFYTMEFVQHEKKSELYNLLFKDLGLDIFRVRNNYDMEPNSFRETVEIINGAEKALNRDIKVMMCSWSPPATLKSNNSTVGGTLKKVGGSYAYDGFALWWLESLAAYKAAGVEVDYVSIQNEPDYLASWDSCQLEPTETAGIAGYDAAFEAVWQKLNSEMGADMPKMIGPETSGLGRAGEYIDELEDKSHIYGYSHHLYNCSGDGDNIPGCGADPDRYISDMDFFKAEYGDKPLLQTEFEHRPGTLEDAINTAITLHNSLTVEGVTAYLYWELFWGPGTGMVSLNDPCTYSITPTYYAFKNYSAFVDSGWQRVDASTDSSYLKASAYISPDRDKMSVVIINTAKSEISLETSFKGFSVSKGEVYRTSETKECDNVGGYDKTKPLKLPAKSITTLALSGS